MAFEGSEKKVEIVVHEQVGSLLKLNSSFWDQVVEQCQAQVLSVVESEDCRAYLLSESSLFVWDNAITMITCGETLLYKSADFFIRKIGVSSIESLFFQRKNEYFPESQKSDFFKDVRALKETLNGQGEALRLGSLDDHHLMLYHYQKDFTLPEQDKTLEVLMYDLEPDVRSLFLDPTLSRESLYEKIPIDKILPGYKVDDYIFKPCGYSLNAVNGPYYYTIHVTPEETSPYVSFETNDSGDSKSIVDRVMGVFQPRSFDLVQFCSKGSDLSFDVDGFFVRSKVETSLESGYQLSFKQLFAKSDILQKPVLLDI